MRSHLMESIGEQQKYKNWNVQIDNRTDYKLTWSMS